LKIIQVSSQRLLKPDYQEPIILRDFVALIPYLQALLRFEKIENFRVIYLNKKNYVIEHELISQGEIGFVQLFARKIVKKALDVHASSLILVHNHPSGDCTPSRQDISQTKILQEALEIFEITVHDHLVIGNGNWSSLKNLGLI
jgi:DNA repair protein RadC